MPIAPNPSHDVAAKPVLQRAEHTIQHAQPKHHTPPHDRQHSMAKSWRQRLKSALYGMVLGLIIPTLAFGQATLLPDAKQQYLDDSGNPVATGTVTYYIPSTSTKKTIWQDAAETTIQSNPVLLDAAGRPQPAGQTYGSGSYRQVVKDSNGVTIWDAVTASTGSGSGGGSSAQSEGIMVGTIIAWANPVLPAKYLYAAGTEVSRTTYSDLLTALTYQLNIICVLGISTVTVPTSVSVSVPIGAGIETACFPAGTVVSSKISGQLTMSNPATATTSVPAVIFPWGVGNGTTTFNLPDLRGRVLAGRDNMNGNVAARLTTALYGTNPDAINAAGGSQTTTLITANLPPYTPAGTVGITDPGHSHSVGGQNGNLVYAGGGGSQTGGGAFDFPGGSVSITANTTGITAGFTGTAAAGQISTPLRTVQPTLTADYIIKVLPDDLPTGPGVTSIQGMTGALSCGAGLTCTAQTISAGNATAIDVGVTQVLDGTTTNILYNNAGVLGERGVATSSDFYAGTANKILTTGTIWNAETTTTYGTTTTFDFNTFKNTKVTLTGNITTMTLTNVKAGQSGMITFIQDGTGSRTSVWSTVFKFAGGTTPTLTTTAAAVDILNFSCRSATFCEASLLADVK